MPPPTPSIKNRRYPQILMNPYIFPTTKVHSSLAAASNYYDEYAALQFFEEEHTPALSDLAQGKRNLIVGEPGVGKTFLLGKIDEHFSANGYATEFVSLRKDDATCRIDAFLALSVVAPKALLLDALDEVKASTLPLMIQKLDDISRDHADVAIYLSSRWVFIKRHATAFAEYRYITISPFSRGQVRDYLKQTDHSDGDIDDLLQRVVSFGHQMLVLQVPRYLFLERFLKERGIEAASKVSRNELFEYFIYPKLAHEDTKLSSDRRAITKRLLEKLALVMEVYQTNVLLMDEVMTFLDETQSDFKLIALAQLSLESFFEYSLLKNNVDSVEFENAEFQEYLAAKEITRFADPQRAAFAFAVDRDIGEIYPTWFNALTFLVDMQADLLEPFVGFSGLRGTEFKVVDKSFFTFVSRVDPRAVAVPVRRRLFGFVGPIVLEVKLTSNTDLKKRRVQDSPSYSSMQRYMQGYGASHGIFLVVDNVGARNLAKLKETFVKIPNVSVQVVDCHHSISPAKAGKGTTRRRQASRRAA